MSWIDWSIVIVYLVWIVWSGLQYGRRKESLDEYLLAGRSLPWWGVGLSVMATQMSAITLIGTTGQAFNDGMKFVQTYLGLPLAMIILSVTVVPFFHKARVYTAYEYLERRFDARTRSMTSFLFLVSRCLGVGVIISAPAVVLSAIIGAPFWITVFGIGLTTTAYTMFGGVRAVTWTDVRQMIVIGVSLVAIFIVIIAALPEGIGFSEAIHTAAFTGRTQTIVFPSTLEQTFSEKYTIWSGLIGGLFLMLSYFGCDQSQVQRYLTAKSVDEGRRSLMMSAFLKIPIQFGILLIGLLVFVFYHYVEPPLIFDPAKEKQLQREHPADYFELKREYNEAFETRNLSAQFLAGEPGEEVEGLTAGMQQNYATANGRMLELRSEALKLTGDKPDGDVNFVFPRFVTTQLPIGIIGLFIAAVFAAAMSSISSELNSLSTATVIDFYRRHYRPDESDEHYLRVSRLFTLGWGIFACIVALFAANLGSLIEVVNRFGSYFYGSLLGVFVLAIGIKRATGRGAFWGLIVGIVLIAILNNLQWITTELTGLSPEEGGITVPNISYLWYNVIGCFVVVVVGLILSGPQPPQGREEGRSATPEIDQST